MEAEPESAYDMLLREHREVFSEFDDLRLARWMAQTLGQLEGRVWRISHPLVKSYRLAAEVAHDRQIWLKRLVTAPDPYGEAPCCRAPMLPLFIREVPESGMICLHCGATVAPKEEIPDRLLQDIKVWISEYNVVHAVAHWDDSQRKAAGNYDRAFETAARKAEGLLQRAGD